MQPVLTSPRLLMRPAASGDLDELWQLWTQPDVRRFLWDDRTIDRHEAEATLADCMAQAPTGLGLWMLEPAGTDTGIQSDGASLGCAGLLPVTTAARYEPRLSGLIEPIVALWPALWGNGYAHEALAALQAYAVETLQVTRLAGVTDVPNEASDRMLRRAGFSVLGYADGPRSQLRTYLWEAQAPAGVQQKLSL